MAGEAPVAMTMFFEESRLPLTSNSCGETSFALPSMHSTPSEVYRSTLSWGVIASMIS